MTNEELTSVSEAIASSLGELRGNSAQCFDGDGDYAVIMDTFASDLTASFPAFDRKGFLARCGLDDSDPGWSTKTCPLGSGQ